MKRSSTLFCTLLLLIVSAVPAFAGKVLAEIEYFYADDGTLIGKAFNGKRVNFEYDLRGQLLAVKDAQGKDLERYTYDPAGNRLSKTINGVTTTYTYDKANQLATSTVNGKTTYYKYDAAGRMIQAGDKTYIYNGQNKVSEVRQNGKTIAKFEYNIDGQIAKAIYGDKVEEFMWDGLALIWRSGVTYINEPYVTGGNPVMAGDAVLFNDMLGNTLAVNGKAVEMSSFGETADKNAFFTGKPMIDELGYSFLFRDYNPNQGKWTTSDPIGYPDGWNNLAYVNNRASNCFDFAGAWLEPAHHSINARWLESNSSFISSATNFKWGEYNSFNIVAIFNAASDWSDSSPNQSDDKAYMHAMRSKNDSYQDASSRYYNYLNQLENLARYTSDLARKAYMEGNYSAATSWMNSALNYLGCLVHTYSDSFSPSHAGFQHFTYWNAPEHLYNERDSVYQTSSSNITSGLNRSYGSLLKFVLKQPE